MPEAKTQTVSAAAVSPKTKLAPKPKAKAKAKAKTAVQTKVVLSKESGESVMPTKSAYKKIEAGFEPVVEFNKMVAGSIESSYNMLMDSYQSYAKLSIDSLQSGLKVRSPEDMVTYFETQQSMAQQASDMMMSDAKSFSDMGVKMFNDVRSMYESGMKTSVSAASEAMKAA